MVAVVINEFYHILLSLHYNITVTIIRRQRYLLPLLTVYDTSVYGQYYMNRRFVVLLHTINARMRLMAWLANITSVIRQRDVLHYHGYHRRSRGYGHCHVDGGRHILPRQSVRHTSTFTRSAAHGQHCRTSSALLVGHVANIIIIVVGRLSSRPHVGQ